MVQDDPVPAKTNSSAAVSSSRMPLQVSAYQLALSEIVLEIVLQSHQRQCVHPVLRQLLAAASSGE